PLAAGVPRVAGRRRAVAVAVLRLPHGRLRLRRRRSLRRRSAVRIASGLRPTGRRRAATRASGGPRLPPEPPVAPASACPRAPGLLPVARAPQQLDQRVRRLRVDSAWRPLLLPRVSARAAGRELAPRGRAAGDARCPAVLVRPGRRRVPDRRAAPNDQEHLV